MAILVKSPTLPRRARTGQTALAHSNLGRAPYPCYLGLIGVNAIICMIRAGIFSLLDISCAPGTYGRACTAIIIKP